MKGRPKGSTLGPARGTRWDVGVALCVYSPRMTHETLDMPLLELTDPALARPLTPALATARASRSGSLDTSWRPTGARSRSCSAGVGVDDAVDREAYGAAEARDEAHGARQEAEFPDQIPS